MELTANSPKSSDACSLRRKTIPKALHLRDSSNLDPDPTLMLTLTNRDHLTSTLMLTPTCRDLLNRCPLVRTLTLNRDRDRCHKDLPLASVPKETLPPELPTLWPAEVLLQAVLLPTATCSETDLNE